MTSMTRWIDFFSALLREGEGGGGAAPNNAADPAPYLPDGLPEGFRGASDKETIDKLYADYAGRPRPPEKADGYTLALAPEFTAKYGDLKDDNVVGIWREVAHELGLSDAQFSGALPKLYEKMDAKGLLDLGPDVEAEIGKLMPKAGDDATRRAEANRRINDAGAWVKGLEAQGLAAENVARLSDLLTDAAGIQTVEFLQRVFAKPGLNGGGKPGGAPDLSGADRATRAMYPSHFRS